MTTLKAPAKLNLWLQLTGRRHPDGRHELRSHFAPLELCDILRLRRAPDFSLTISGPFGAGVPGDETNLVWQAFAQFCQTFRSVAPVHVDLEKNIPSGAGLGGGSSDAGTLLAYLARQADVSLEEVERWSMTLGADVPFAVRAHSRLVEGVGEALGPPLPVPRGPILLIKPPDPCPTGAVFVAVGRAGVRPSQSHNDLEPAALQVCPAMKPILDYLRGAYGSKAQVTGSGSTCFAFVEDGPGSAARAKECFPSAWIQITHCQPESPENP